MNLINLKEILIGDTVECIFIVNPDSKLKIGSRYKITSKQADCLELEGLFGGWTINQFKKVTNEWDY